MFEKEFNFNLYRQISNRVTSTIVNDVNQTKTKIAFQFEPQT